MKLLSTLPAALALLGTVAASAPQGTYKTQICYTSKYSTKPKSTHRYTTTTTTKNVKTITKTTTKTITPTATTTTSTDLTTTIVTEIGLPTTDTASDSTTATETDTITVGTLVSTTVTTTVDGGVSTSTIATSNGFLPIQTSLPGSTLDPPSTKRERKRMGGSAVELSERTSPNPANGLKTHLTACKYPGTVSCIKYYEQCSTKTVWHTVTRTAAQPTVSATITSTVTSTSTSTPGVSTTTTVTIDTTTVTTVTTTETSTSTASETTYASTTSFYAACATNNMATFVNGVAIVGGNTDPSRTFQKIVGGVQTAYDCCVAALLDPVGAIWALSQVSGNTCVVVDSTTTCDASKGASNVVVTSGSDPAWNFGNANCGAWNGVQNV